jgi:hypothetical protein
MRLAHWMLSVSDYASSIGDADDSESEEANALRVKIQRLAHEL